MTSSVLVVTPTWITEDGALAMRPECAESVAAQVWEGRVEHLVTTDNPYPVPSNRNVYHQYLRIREQFLAGDWDWMLMLEHDNRLPDADALRRMVETDRDVVYAPYMLRHGIRVLSTWQYVNDRNLGSSWSNNDAAIARARKAVVKPVSGVGFGCTLVRRSVVERIPFREWTPESVCAPDIPFATDCLRAGIRPVGRFDVPVDHWDAGEWIDPYEVVMHREYIALATVNAYAGEDPQYIELKEGLRYPLPYDVAWSLAQRGLVKEVSAEEPAPAALTDVPPAPKPAKAQKRRPKGK